MDVISKRKLHHGKAASTLQCMYIFRKELLTWIEGTTVQKDKALKHHCNAEKAFWSFGISSKSKPRDKPVAMIDSIIETTCSIFGIRLLINVLLVLFMLNRESTSSNREQASCSHSKQFSKTEWIIGRSAIEIFKSFVCETNSCKVWSILSRVLPSSI